MDKAELVNSLDGEDNLGNVESCNIFREDFILDKHSHQISAGQEFHEHVEEVGVLESGVQLDDPRAVGFGQDITF